MTVGMLAGSGLAAAAGSLLALGESALRLGDWLAMNAGMVGGMLLAERGLGRLRGTRQAGKSSSPASSASKATPPRFCAERLPSTITE